MSALRITLNIVYGATVGATAAVRCSSRAGVVWHVQFSAGPSIASRYGVSRVGVSIIYSARHDVNCQHCISQA